MQIKEVAFKVFWYLFPVLVLFAAQFLINSFPRLQNLKIKNIDMATGFLVIGLHELSSHFYRRSIFPYWLIIAMFLMMGAGFFLTYRNRRFNLGKILKLFWRLAFLMTITLYILFIFLTFAS